MLLAAIAPVFVIILAGFLLRRSGLLSAQADASLMRIYVNLLYPCLILVTILGNPALHQRANVWLPPVAGFLTVALGFLFCWIGARLLRVPRGASTRTFTYVTGIYNFGYTAIPVVGSLFGSRALGVLFIFNLGVEVAFWMGASLILSTERDRSAWRKVINAPVVTILCAVALNFLNLKEHTPVWILAALQMLGGAAIPLALLLTGAIITDFLGEARPSRTDGVRLAGACGLRLGVLPLVFLGLAHLLPGTVELKQVLVVQSAMPAAMLPVVLCKHYGSEVGLAVQIVIGTTCLALLTMPYWISFGLKILGV
jgi:predicted permease